jgi:hypothetical protein
VRSGTGRGRQGPGLLGATGRPAVLPESPASGRASARAPAVGAEFGAAGGLRHDQAPPGQQRVDFRQGRWLPRHQPWNAASTGGTGHTMDELSAQVDELDRLERGRAPHGGGVHPPQDPLLGT